MNDQSDDEFFMRDAAFARVGSVYYTLQRVSPLELAAAAKSKVAGVPRYWTEFCGASYFWPKRSADCEIVWSWRFDERRRDWRYRQTARTHAYGDR